MKKIVVIAAFLLLVAGCSEGEQPTSTSQVPPVPMSPSPTTAPATATAMTILIPPGEPVTIDGILTPGEWDAALTVDLANGTLYLMYAQDFLYLGIRSDRLGLGSICVKWDDAISILHSSAALGTATYMKSDGGWQKTRDFSWTNRDVSNSQQALEERRDHLQREKWLASNGRMGHSNEMEYQIAMTHNELTLGVTYLLKPEYVSTDYWPSTLAADCRTFTPAPDGPPETATFMPESWITVRASDQPIVTRSPLPVAAVAMPPTVIPTVPPATATAKPELLTEDRERISAQNAGDLIQLRQSEIPGFLELHETCGVTFSPDGHYLAAACRSTTIPLWNVQTGEIVHLIGGGGYAWSNVAFSPDGKILASSGLEDAISFWDVDSGELLRKIEDAPGYMSEVTFSPDGKYLAAGSFSGSAMVWDVATGNLLSEFFGHHSRVNCISFSPAGSLVVTGGGDNKARTWLPSSGEEILALSGATYFVEDVEFSPSGQQIAGASDNGRIYLWDAATGDLIMTLRGHSGPVNGVTFSPDGRLLASTSNDRTLRLWDAGSHESLARLTGHTDLAIRSAFNPDGSLIASVGWDGTVRLWGLPESTE